MESDFQTMDDAKYGLPFVSVILPVYNGAGYLADSVNSILTQTYKNFELIIINDGSTDDSAAIIHKITDPRIRYFEQENQGLAATLNRAIGLARGEFIARQDQDDTSLPHRLEKQVDYLRSHCNCGMVGTWAEIWVDDTRTERAHKHPADNASLQFFLLFNNPFVHSSVMLRKEVFDRVGLYCTDRSRQPPEDYELWSRVAREFDVANIPEMHLIYREVPTSMSRDGVNPFLEKVINISAENIAWATKRSSADPAVRTLAALNHGATHLLQSLVRFKVITALFSRAVEDVCHRSGVAGHLVKTTADTHLYAIWYHYYTYRFGKHLGGVMSALTGFMHRKITNK